MPKWKTLAVAVLCCLWLCRIGLSTAQQLPLPPGAGYTWERVGDRAAGAGYHDLTFDAGGTLWVAPDGVPGWLDRSAGGAGVWQFAPRVNGPQPYGQGILTLGGYPTGGLARADTILYTYYGSTGRSVDGGITWSPDYPIGNQVLIEVPQGYPYAGRILVGAAGNVNGSLIGYSDDRGANWIYSNNVPPADQFGVTELLVLPPSSLLSRRRLGA